MGNTKKVYITMYEPPRIAINIGRSYICTDFLGTVLSEVLTPFKREGGYYVCRNSKGGYVWIMPAEFVREKIQEI